MSKNKSIKLPNALYLVCRAFAQNAPLDKHTTNVRIHFASFYGF